MSRRVVWIVLSDVAVLRAILGSSAILFAFGLWFADPNGGAYNGMLQHAPAWVWGIGFFVYGLTKFRLAFGIHSKLFSYTVVMLGTYLWLFTILSVVNNPNRAIGSADLILSLLVVAEVWVGASTVAGERDASA
jgi:hypothetical protein